MSTQWDKHDSQAFGSASDYPGASCSSSDSTSFSVMQGQPQLTTDRDRDLRFSTDYPVASCSTASGSSQSQPAPELCCGTQFPQGRGGEYAVTSPYRYPLSKQSGSAESRFPPSVYTGEGCLNLPVSVQYTHAPAPAFTPRTYPSQTWMRPTSSGPQPSPRKASASSLVDLWAARFGSCALPLNPLPPPLSATRQLLRERVHLPTIQQFCTIISKPMPPNVCSTICFIDAKSTPVPVGQQPGAPVFVMSHIGPLGRTGWAPVVQVMSRAFKEDEYTYMGRYTFRWRPASEARLPAEEWTVLPEEMKHHIARRIQYARDEHAKKICARAYLRAGSKAVDPPAVRDLMMRDKRRKDRFARSGECAGMRQIREALEEGTEKLYLYSLQCDAYDEEFANALRGLLESSE